MKNAMTHTDLMRKISVSTDKYGEILRTLVARNEIQIFPGVEMAMGRKPSVIQLKEMNKQ
jgi:hypothetical protein